MSDAGTQIDILLMIGEYKKVVGKLSHDLRYLAELSDSKTNELSHQFQQLSQSANSQTQHLQELIDISQKVCVGDKYIDIKDISEHLQKTFVESISHILEMSKQAMVMVYILDDALKTLVHIENSIQEIEVINHKTKYLALNATIEAVRAGEVGQSFQVVASEVRELSNDTQRLATNIRGQVTQMANTLNRAQTILQTTASVNMTDNISAKDQLDEMMVGLVTNSQRMAVIMEDARKTTDRFSDATSNLIMDIQYQDRLQQDVSYMLSLLGSMDASLDHALKDHSDAFSSTVTELETLLLRESLSKEFLYKKNSASSDSESNFQDSQQSEQSVTLF